MDSDCCRITKPCLCLVFAIAVLSLFCAETGFAQVGLGTPAELSGNGNLPVPITGACCLPGGGCIQAPNRNYCEAQGGTFQGRGTLCSVTACPVQGMCCIDGVCTPLSEDECVSACGVFLPNHQCLVSSDANGPTIACPLFVAGACCIDNLCIDGVSQHFCECQGGTWQGDFTTCHTLPALVCAQPITGACCLQNGVCVELTQPQCEAQCGVFQGPGTTCNSILCPISIPPVPTGACCLPNGQCEVTTRCRCDGAGGTFLGFGTTCNDLSGTQAPCPAPLTGACCLPNGNCIDTDARTCEMRCGGFVPNVPCATVLCIPLPTGACCIDGMCHITNKCRCERNGGSYRGDGTTCGPDVTPIDPVVPDGFNPGVGSLDLSPGIPVPTPIPLPNPCRDPMDGGCCLPDGTCIVTGPVSCRNRCGKFFGPGSDCSTDQCVEHPTGACCIDGECYDITECQCEQRGGAFRGNGTTCVSVLPVQPCPVPVVGACCLPDGTCVHTDPLSCQLVCGQFAGPDTNCLYTECEPLPVGACCLSDVYGTQCEMLTACECNQAGGEFLGDGSFCYPGICDPPPPIGACCLPNGQCVDTTEEDCLAQCGSPVPPGIFCATVLCVPHPTGACCIDGIAGPVCVDGLTECQCLQATNGQYLGDGSVCYPFTCQPVVGACCLPDGSCIETTPEACAAQCGGFTAPGVLCATTLCIPHATGACCLGGNQCTELTECECAQALGDYQGDGTACSGNSCGGGGCTIDRDKELFIRDLSVVNDVRTNLATNPADCGPWTFPALMAAIAGTDDRQALSDYVLAWMDHWDQNLTINSFPVPARTNMHSLVVQPWIDLSLGPDQPLDFSFSPFRLLAIVYRPDLRNGDPSRGPISGGEGRFVFGVLDNQGGGFFSAFTVIFEFNLKADSCSEIKDWADQWHALGSLPFDMGNQDVFNSALQAITDQFATINADPSRLNGSSINQVRTNEIQLDNPWELREFRLGSSSEITVGAVPLTESTVAQTPDFETFNGSPLLVQFLTEFEQEILAETHEVPLVYQGTNFRAGRAITLPGGGGQWVAPGISEDVRQLFAINTCSGCHFHETVPQTVFQHVEERAQNNIADISTWLDQTDLPRREDDLCALLGSSCGEIAIEAMPAGARVH